MRAKYIGIAAAIGLTAITVSGCGEREKDYDVYFSTGNPRSQKALNQWLTNTRQRQEKK